MATSKHLVYTLDGKLSVVIPSPKWGGTLEDLAAAVVPVGAEWKIVDTLPPSRNWRNAWVLAGGEVEVDLARAKEVHKELIVKKSQERLERDVFGNQDFSTVKAEMETCGITEASTLDELYNAWPRSIDTRLKARKYLRDEMNQLQ